MNKQKNKLGIIDLSYLPLIISASLTIVIVWGIYNQNQNILKETLRERLIAIVSTAALQFNSDDLEVIRDEGQLHSIELRKVVNTMNKIRSANKNLRYIYIWRKTDDPNYLAFVADAEMLEPIDINGNGIIEDDEAPPLPGEEYAIDQIPESSKLFDRSLAQDDFIVDKWGTFLSGFAPIRDTQGKAVAVLGVDVEVGDFFRIIRATFTPFLILTIVLLFLLSVQTIALIRIWRTRVNIISDLDRQKDELLGLVAHQLAKPITALRWNLESFLDGDLGELTPEQKEETKTMSAQVVHLADLVSMILDVSKIQLGKITPDSQPLDLNQLLTEVLQVIQPAIREKKIVFTKDVQEGLPIVLLDKRYTRMTIENLLTNAVKYTPEGGKVTLRFKLEKGILSCKVSDTGCGIPDAEKGKIFGKMYRGTNVRNTVEGNGFGLYVAKGAIESQGGTLGFTSKLGKGTTFSFTLPVKEPPK